MFEILSARKKHAIAWFSKGLKKIAKSGVNSKRKIELHKNDSITVLTQIEIVKPKRAQKKTVNI